jgi:hypothetical protein
VDLTVRVNGSSVVTTGVRTFAAGVDYTVLTYGAVGAGTTLVVTDDNRLPSATTRAKIRLINGVAGSSPMTMSLDYLPLAADVAVGGVSAYATANVAGASRIDITSTTSTDALYSVTATTTSALLQGQGVYTVFMLGGKSTPTGVFRRER